MWTNSIKLGKEKESRFRLRIKYQGDQSCSLAHAQTVLQLNHGRMNPARSYSPEWIAMAVKNPPNQCFYGWELFRVYISGNYS